jgi:hypothetical protein
MTTGFRYTYPIETRFLENFRMFNIMLIGMTLCEARPETRNRETGVVMTGAITVGAKVRSLRGRLLLGAA